MQCQWELTEEMGTLLLKSDENLISQGVGSVWGIGKGNSPPGRDPIGSEGVRTYGRVIQGL